MKLWLPPRPLPNHTNLNRIIPSYALHSRHILSIFIRGPHLPRRKLRMTPSKHPRQRSFPILHLHLSPHRPRPILWILRQPRNLKHRRYSSPRHNGNSLLWLCSSLRSNVLLRSYSNHQPSFSNPIYRTRHRPMTLRRILSKKRHTNTIFHIPLRSPLHHSRTIDAPPSLPSRNRIKQPNRPKFKHRQGNIPHLLLL